MGRKSTFSDQKVFSAVSKQVGSGVGFRIQDLAVETGISIGSLYHRYQSREGVLAAAWLDALRSFHTEFLAALDTPGRAAGELAAMATPRFSRQHRDKAIILCLSRRETMLAENAPQELLAATEEENANMKRRLETFAARENLSHQACMHGIIGFPLAAVKLYLPHAEVPMSVDHYVKAAYRSAIELNL